jgi:hypothetical protein
MGCACGLLSSDSSHVLSSAGVTWQGYMVGNGCTDMDFDGNAQVPFAVGKSLISTTLYKRAEAACDGNYWDYKDGSRWAVTAVCFV